MMPNAAGAQTQNNVNGFDRSISDSYDSGVDESVSSVRSPAPIMQSHQPATSQLHNSHFVAGLAAETAAKLRLHNPPTAQQSSNASKSRPFSAVTTNNRQSNVPSTYSNNNFDSSAASTAGDGSSTQNNRTSRRTSDCRVKIFHEKRDYSHVRSKIAADIAGGGEASSDGTAAVGMHSRSRSTPRGTNYARTMRAAGATPSSAGNDSAARPVELSQTLMSSQSFVSGSVTTPKQHQPPWHNSKLNTMISNYQQQRAVVDAARIESKIGSLANVTHKPRGGDRRIFSERLPRYTTAQAKVGSFQNAEHVPGGGNKPIETQTLRWQAEAKIGSLDHVKGPTSRASSRPPTRQHSPERQS